MEAEKPPVSAVQRGAVRSVQCSTGWGSQERAITAYIHNSTSTICYFRIPRSLLSALLCSVLAAVLLCCAVLRCAACSLPSPFSFFSASSSINLALTRRFPSFSACRVVCGVATPKALLYYYYSTNPFTYLPSLTCSRTRPPWTDAAVTTTLLSFTSIPIARCAHCLNDRVEEPPCVCPRTVSRLVCQARALLSPMALNLTRHSHNT